MQAEVHEAAPVDHEDRLLNEYEVEAEFGVGVRALRRWRHEGVGEGPPIVRLGRLRRYRRGAVRAWLRAQEAAPVASGGGETAQ